MVALIPVTGLTLILTLRFGAKPFMEALAQQMRETGMVGTPNADARILDLSEQVEMLSAELLRLREAQAFDKQLGAANPPGADSPTAPTVGSGVPRPE